MDNDTKTQDNKGFFSKHTLMMMLSCIIPLVLIGILWIAGVSQNILSFGILLMCPIIHLLMMKNMKHNNHENQIGEDKKEIL